MEAFKICQNYSGKEQKYEYLEDNRIGDHICYYSDLSKINSHFPEFEIKHDLERTIEQIIKAQLEKKIMPKICLSIVFNHQFEKNIPKLNELYEGRFSFIRYLSPLVQGKQKM